MHFCMVSLLYAGKIYYLRHMSRIEEEKRVVELMIRLYCRHKEGNDELCDSCKALLQYAHARLSKCAIHCYKPDMREQMRAVMRYAGPRMLLHHPWYALKHMWQELR